MACDAEPSRTWYRSALVPSRLPRRSSVSFFVTACIHLAGAVYITCATCASPTRVDTCVSADFHCDATTVNAQHRAMRRRSTPSHRTPSHRAMRRRSTPSHRAMRRTGRLPAAWCMGCEREEQLSHTHTAAKRNVYVFFFTLLKSLLAFRFAQTDALSQRPRAQVILSQPHTV